MIWSQNISSEITVHWIFLNAISQRAQNTINNIWIWLARCSKFHRQDISEFTSLYLNIYVSAQNLHLLSQQIHDETFSDTYLVSYFFTCFQIFIWIIFCFFSYMSIVHILWIQEVFGIHCKLIPERIK